MPKTTSRRWFQYLLLAALSGAPLLSQMTVTGTVSGTVTDPSGQVIPGAKVTLTSTTTSEPRSAAGNEIGEFHVVAVQPGTYNLRVEHAGFKAYERRNVVVSANEHVALGDIMMQIGDVAETVSVVAEAAQVQTDSSEHSAALTTTQLTNLTARGREVV
jgi:hypothetical protein